MQALAGCDFNSQQVKRLIDSSPLSGGTFGEQVMYFLKEASILQAKLMQWILFFSTTPGKGPALQQGGTTPKKPKSRWFKSRSP